MQRAGTAQHPGPRTLADRAFNQAALFKEFFAQAHRFRETRLENIILPAVRGAKLRQQESPDLMRAGLIRSIYSSDRGCWPQHFFVELQNHRLPPFLREGRFRIGRLRTMNLLASCDLSLYHLSIPRSPPPSRH